MRGCRPTSSARPSRSTTRSAKLRRAEELSAQQLIPASDLDTARDDRAPGGGGVEVGTGAGRRRRARRSNQAGSTSSHAIITAPIDGIVVSRNVDVGQTVAASMQAPTLFVLAQDLTRMQVNASVDESDIGQIRPGQQVSFRVDAYPRPGVHRHGPAGAPRAGRRAERRELHDGDRCAESGAEAEAGHDGERDDRDRPGRRRAARAERGAALPAATEDSAAGTETRRVQRRPNNRASGSRAARTTRRARRCGCSAMTG